MLVTKLKMQNRPYGDFVIFAQTEHLELKRVNNNFLKS